jgi:Transcriptional regulator PadR-like family
VTYYSEQRCAKIDLQTVDDLGSAETAPRKRQDVSGRVQDEGGGHGAGPRLSERTVRILEVLADQPHVWHFSLELADAAGLKQGTIYPNLVQLETLGWILSGSEDAD